MTYFSRFETSIPPNCHFEVDDLGKEWLYSPRKFDLIHGRQISSFFDPVHIVYNTYNALKDGGVLEVQEFTWHFRCDDGSWKDSWLKYWLDLFLKGLKELGLDNQMTDYPELMKQHGFENVKYKSFVWPINTWMTDEVLKPLGKYFRLFLSFDLEGLSLWIFTKALGWEERRVRILCALVTRDLRDPSIHVCTDAYVISLNCRGNLLTILIAV